MDNMRIIKHFYEYATSNNLIDGISEYIADNCIVRIGERIIPVGNSEFNTIITVRLFTRNSREERYPRFNRKII